MTHDYFSKPFGRIPKKKPPTPGEITKSVESAKRRASWDRESANRRADRVTGAIARAIAQSVVFARKGAQGDRDLMALGLSARQCDYLGKLIEECDALNDLGGGVWKVAEQRAAIRLLQAGHDFEALLVHAERGTLQRFAEKNGASPALFGSRSPTAISVTYDPRKFSKVDGSPLPAPMASSTATLTIDVKACKSLTFKDAREKLLDGLKQDVAEVRLQLRKGDKPATPDVAEVIVDDFGGRHDPNILMQPVEKSMLPFVGQSWVNAIGEIYHVARIETRESGDRLKTHFVVELRKSVQVKWEAAMDDRTKHVAPASGGVVSPGAGYLVGEASPERFFPKRKGFFDYQNFDDDE